MKGAIAKAETLATELGAWMPMQFNNPANPAIHEKTTGQEILEAFGETKIDAFVAGVGTGGTVSGVSHTLKMASPTTAIYAVEAEESAVLSGQEPYHIKSKAFQQGLSPIP